MPQTVDPQELSRIRELERRKAELTDRPFTKEEVRWTPAQINRIAAALVVHGD